MSKLICYIDGSEIPASKNKIRQGWGIVAHHHAGGTVEISGVVEHSANDKSIRGYYEILAFYNAICYAEGQGLIPPEVSFYTDYDWLAEAGFHFVKNNYSGKKLSIFLRLSKIQTEFYKKDKHVIARMIRWLTGSQMHWVKGHSGIISNHRADHLAHAAVTKQKVIPLAKWINDGFGRWNKERNTSEQYFLPFTKPATNPAATPDIKETKVSSYTRVSVTGSNYQMKQFCRDSFGPSGFIKGNIMPWRCCGDKTWIFKNPVHATAFALRWSGVI
jgi:ribonuclease HI